VLLHKGLGKADECRRWTAELVASAIFFKKGKRKHVQFAVKNAGIPVAFELGEFVTVMRDGCYRRGEFVTCNSTFAWCARAHRALEGEDVPLPMRDMHLFEAL
jgi:hypothetical protein